PIANLLGSLGSRGTDDEPLPSRAARVNNAAMNHDAYADDYLRAILSETRTIAVVGASPSPQRPSHGVMRYLQRRNYRVIPVNPMAAGTTILGEPVYARLAEVPVPVDMVDIFRRSELAGAAADAAIAIGAKTIWMQLA